jgi:hypothetical protein
LTGASVGAGRTTVPPDGWHWLLGLHESPAGQLPQLSVPPQPSGMLPHELVGHVAGTHVCATQTLFVHVAFVAQVPQLSVPPQPSGMLPQFLPWAAHVVGVHVPPVWHTPDVHVSPTGQEHVIVPPQPSPIVPHALPTPPEPHVMGTHAGWHVPLLAELHCSPLPQAQVRVPPQPLGMLPQESPWAPAGHVFTVQPH